MVLLPPGMVNQQLKKPLRVRPPGNRVHFKPLPSKPSRLILTVVHRSFPQLFVADVFKLDFQPNQWLVQALGIELYWR